MKLPDEYEQDKWSPGMKGMLAGAVIFVVGIFILIVILNTNNRRNAVTLPDTQEQKPVADDLVRNFLMQQLQVPDYKAEVCVAFARGNIGKAKSLASSEDFDNIKNEALSLLKYIQDMDLNEITSAIKKITEYKLQINDYLDLIAIWYRDVLLFKATSDVNHLVFREEISAIRRVAQRSSYEGIEEVIEALDKAKRRLDANVNFDLTMELLMLEIKENG